ncbi:MAG: FecR family protein [Methylococcales bacterium]
MPHSSNKASVAELMQQASEWFVRLRSEDISDQELYAFADWLAQDHQHSEAFAATEKLFSDMVIAAKTMDIPGQTANVSTLRSELCPAQTKAKTHTVSWLSLAAAAAVCLIVVKLIMPEDTYFLTDYLSEYHTKIGEVREIKLADGSRLLLDTNSAVSTEFNAAMRQITLHHGQVRFSVANDTQQRPFEVLADGLVVTALGTVFDIYKHKSTDDISVTVQEHAVSVRAAIDVQAQRTVKVNAGQQLHYRPGLELAKPDSVDLNQVSAWQQQRLFINDRPLRELITELDRYRSGRIFLADAELQELRVTGVFSLTNPDDVLDKVCKVLNLKQTELGAWLVLLHR